MSEVMSAVMSGEQWRVDDEESFMTCYRATVADVFGYAAMLCGRDRATAEDLVQHVYLEVLRRGRGGAVRSVNVSYLLGTVRLRFLDDVKRRSREQRRLELVATTEQPATTPTVAIEQLGDLSERERIAVVLRYVDDLTVAGVAKQMSISTRAAESLLARATKRLRGGERRNG